MKVAHSEYRRSHLLCHLSMRCHEFNYCITITMGNRSILHGLVSIVQNISIEVGQRRIR